MMWTPIEMLLKKVYFFKCIVACVHLYICVYKSALTSSITTSGLWEPSREPHQPSPLMVTHMIHGFPRPFVFITPPRQLASCIAVSCNASKFGPEREERMSRGEVFLALKETKGLGFGMDKKLKAEWRTAVAAFFFFSQLLLRFRGSQGFLKCQCWKTRSWKPTEKSKAWQLLQHSVWCSQFFLSFKSSAL